MKKPVFFILWVVAVVGALWVALTRQPSQPGQWANAPALGQKPDPGAVSSGTPGVTAPIVSGRPSEPPVSLTGRAQSQLRVLDEILKSRNDNDPRMDTDLKSLDPSARAELRSRYHSMSRERLNDRGTVAFLLGRNLSSPEDVGFLQQVLEESPCLSLADCSRDAGEPRGEEVHLESANETTLVYPQLVSIRSLDLLLRQSPLDPALRESALRALRAAESSRSPRVAEAARQALQRASISVRSPEAGN